MRHLMDGDDRDFSSMKFVHIHEEPDGAFTISWTKLWDRRFLGIVISSPFWIFLVALFLFLLGGFVGGILYFTPLSSDLKELISFVAPNILILIVMIISILAALTYIVFRKQLTRIKLEKDRAIYIRMKFPTNNFTHITYHDLDESQEMEKHDDLDDDFPDWLNKLIVGFENFVDWLTFERLFYIHLHSITDEPFTIDVPTSDGPELAKFLSNYLNVPLGPGPSAVNEPEHISDEERVKQQAKEEYNDWDNKSLGKWIFDYCTGFLPKLIIVILILSIISLGMKPL